MRAERNNDGGWRRLRSQAGVTLLELLVAMVVAGIVVGLGVPTFRAFTLNQNRLAGINDLSYSLAVARSEALKRAQFATVCRSTNGTSCAGAGDDWSVGWIVFSNTAAANAAVRDGDEPILYSYASVPDNVALSTADLGAGLVTFRPSGDLGLDATWTWCDPRGDEQARAVVIDQAGRARVSTVDADGEALECP